MNVNLQTFDEKSFSDAIETLIGRDEDLLTIVEKYGVPNMWIREKGFAPLLQIILEQQVSVAAGRAVFGKLERATDELTPENFLLFDDEMLKSFGFSRQKTLYCRELALAVLENRIDLDSLETLDNEAVKRELIKLKGVGNWTADVYLMSALRRIDAFPVGDLALQIAAQKVKKLENRPNVIELEIIGEIWRPFRAVATHILWHFYVNENRSKKNKQKETI